MLYHIQYPCRYDFCWIDLLHHYLFSNGARKTELTCLTKIHYTNTVFEFIYEPVKCRLMLSVGCRVYWIATDGILKHNQTYFRHRCLFSTTHCSLLKLIVRSGLDVPNFATRRLHACHQRQKVELWGRNVREFCLHADFHVTFRDLLHAIKLRHGTDGFTSPPKEGVLRIFLLRGFGRVRTRKLGYQRPARYL